jgi:hypothetical protein
MIMKYKDLGTMLSNDEMKKVQGGDPPTKWICTIFQYYCSPSKLVCDNNCHEPCIIESGYCEL